MMLCQYPILTLLLGPSYGFYVVLLVAGKGSKSHSIPYKKGGAGQGPAPAFHYPICLYQVRSKGPHLPISTI